MDPLGFSLENFDALGKWRTLADDELVDASASLPDGTQFVGIAGLRGLLMNHKEDFVRTLSEKMLAYAVGRGIESSDLPAVRRIARDAAAGEYRWESVVLAVVKSTPFAMGMVKSAPAAVTAAADRPVDR
jgi:hypothetical protein